MVEGFLTVAQQVLGLFILIGVGVICGKTRMLTQEAVKCCADIVLLLATPCVIIQSFQKEYQPELLVGLGIAALAAIGSHLLGIALAHLLIRDKDDARKRVLRFGTVFSNAGYMAIPLQAALLGQEGVFYGAVYVAVFNLVVWSYGAAMMGDGVKSLSPRKLLLSPGVIGVAIGLTLFLCRITLPSVIAAPIGHLASLNTPVPMLIIGFYLANADLKSALRDRGSYLSIALRLIVIPLLMLGILWLCGVRGTVLVSAVVGASAPVATATTMFATKFGRDPALSVNLVVLSTVLSMLTMPLIIGLAMAV
jgi:predicted permease